MISLPIVDERVVSLIVSNRRFNGIDGVVDFFTCPCFCWFLCRIHIASFTWISCRTLPCRQAAVPAVHVWPGRKSQTKTLSPTLKLTRLSNFSGLLAVALGSIACLIVRMVLPINTSAGDFPMSLGWALVLCVMKNRLINISVQPSSFGFEQVSFRCTHEFLSLAIRLQMKGRRPICSIALALEYSFKLTKWSCVPLSYTIVSGRPWVENMLSRTLNVAEALVDDVVITSGYLECEYTKTRQVTPLMGPAKSTPCFFRFRPRCRIFSWRTLRGQLPLQAVFD